MAKSALLAVLRPEPQPKDSHLGRVAAGEEINPVAFATLLDFRYWKKKKVLMPA